MIEVKEAIRVAEKYIQEIMPEYSPAKLEEVEFSEPFQAWLITFAAPLAGAPKSLEEVFRPRSYKIVQVSATDGKLIAIKNKAA